ncbi:MAG: Gfo/Idh/MocA family oxidoreductase [Dehalococcoidales bacterium]|nr:Gfo/Idh/MocA family oxidoreductase [Dehalococcoidales bacterium]
MLEPTVVSLGVVGAGDESTKALVERLGRGSVFAQGPVQLAGRAGSGAAEEWSAMLNDPTLDAVYVGGPTTERAALAAAVLGAGKAVLCPMPCALNESDISLLERASAEGVRAGGSGLLLTPTGLTHTAAAKGALAMVQSGELGPLLSIYIAAKTSRVPGVDILDALGYDLFDFILSCTAADLLRVHCAGGSLFGRTSAATGLTADILAMTMRFGDGLIVTAEIAACLPDEGQSRGPEVEIDIVGRDGALRVEPGRQEVTICGPGRKVQKRDWHPHPVVSMVEELGAALASGTTGPWRPAHGRRVLSAMQAVKASLAG